MPWTTPSAAMSFVSGIAGPHVYQLAAAERRPQLGFGISRFNHRQGICRYVNHEIHDAGSGQCFRCPASLPHALLSPSPC